jgi:hypothetical protein
MIWKKQLASIFLVITNGRRLIILKRQRFRGEEVVFDDSIQTLLDRTRALDIYRQLQFELVKQLKEEHINTLAHALYTELIIASKHYPDLQAQLARGDFEPSTSQENRRLTVIKPTVAITCKLPIASTEGSCSIEFSNIMLRGLTCHLSHSEILEDLLIGLETSPEWMTRRFLVRTKQGSLSAHLGKTTVILTELTEYDNNEIDGNALFGNVGPRGFWTATYIHTYMDSSTIYPQSSNLLSRLFTSFPRDQETNVWKPSTD